jgi:hypothetical protein
MLVPPLGLLTNGYIWTLAHHIFVTYRSTYKYPFAATGFRTNIGPMTKHRINWRCQVCRHEQKWRIELLRSAGASLDSLAAKFGVDRDAIWRHWRGHVTDEAKASYLCGPVDMEKLAEKAALEGDSVIDYLRMCRATLVAQMAAMNDAGDARGAAYVAAQLTKTLEAMARITGELGDLARSTVFNVTNNVAVLSEHPAFARMQATMLRALGPFPDARAAVVDALRHLDAEGARTATASPAIGIGRVIEHEPA